MLGLTNRETALMVWLMIMFIAVLSMRSTRPLLAHTFRSALAWKILVPFLLFTAYMAAATWLAWHAGLWTSALVTDSIVWFLTVALGLFLKSNEALSTRRHYLNTFLAAVGVIATFEFFSGLYSLPIAAEFVMQGVLGFLGGLWAFAQTQDRYRTLARGLSWLFGIVGIALLVVSLSGFVGDVQAGNVGWSTTWRRFVLPIWMTAVAIGYLWCLSLAMAYEVAFTRLRSVRLEGMSTWRARIALVAVAGVRTHAVGSTDMMLFKRMVRTPRVRDAKRVYRDWSVEKAKAALPLPPGEVDANATRDSLRFLSTCHMGHYRNDGRYRADLITIVESSFSRYGLPTNHEVVHRVSEDGQSWWAWRTLLDGQCVGIGAQGTPPDTSYYEGDGPPTSDPPGDGWRDQMNLPEESSFW